MAPPLSMMKHRQNSVSLPTVCRTGLGEHVALAPLQLHLLQETQLELQRRRTLPENEGIVAWGAEHLKEAVSYIAEKAGLELSSIERDELLAYLERDQKPFGLLQALVENTEVTDIIVYSFSKIVAQIGRCNYLTGLTFPSPEIYESYVEHLLRRAGASYSTRTPIADGMIGSVARVHAMHKSICDEGPYLTIRLNRFSRITIDDLVEAGLAPKAVFNYLERIVCSGLTVLIVGEVGTGKTTLARALAATIPPTEAILVIEDTPEIRLEHPHVRYVRTRSPNIEDVGKVSPSECIRAGMRMAMSRIMFGEIRDAEAAEAFIDVCASGHPGLSTIHGKNSSDALARLELFLGRAQKGVTRDVIADQIVTAVQVVVFLNICPITGVRRIMEVRELCAVTEGRVSQREMFRYQPEKGGGVWRVIGRISRYKKQLESGSNPMFLNELCESQLLDPVAEYREALERDGFSERRVS